MHYLSVCSGIEAATVAWEPLGWKAVGFSEIEKFPSNVLAHYYPDVPNFGDMTQYETWARTDIDVLVGGTPCQSFSVAGLRKGMQDPRGNLALTYLAIAERYRPRWLVWENVPGVLSSNEGRDFGSFLGGLGKLGYGFSYRVLDAQYFGVPQRRRRVFVVGCIGDWRSAAKVLFEPESLQRNPPPSRETREEVAGTSTSRSNSGGWSQDVDLAASGYMRTVPETVGALTDGAHNGGGLNGQDAYSGRIFPCALPERGGGGYGVGMAVAFAQNQRDEVRLMDKAGALAAEPGAKQQTYVAFGLPGNWIGRKPENGGNATEFPEERSPSLTATDRHGVVKAFTASEQSNSYAWERDVYPTLDAQVPNDTSNLQKGIRCDMAVRRLTPLECERLQGFGDKYTDIPGASDSARYKALGNSMAVPVMRWIGERIDAVHKGEDSASFDQ